MKYYIKSAKTGNYISVETDFWESEHRQKGEWSMKEAKRIIQTKFGGVDWEPVLEPVGISINKKDLLLKPKKRRINI